MLQVLVHGNRRKGTGCSKKTSAVKRITLWHEILRWLWGHHCKRSTCSLAKRLQMRAKPDASYATTDQKQEQLKYRNQDICQEEIYNANIDVESLTTLLFSATASSIRTCTSSIVVAVVSLISRQCDRLLVDAASGPNSRRAELVFGSASGKSHDPASRR